MDVRQLESEQVYEQALAFVSAYRRQKIALLKHQKDKNRSLGAALALHRGLMEYGLEERMMEYDNGALGKPFLRYYPELFFSLSHSGDYAICSIGREMIGNDIETVKSGRLKVAERFFAQEEKEWILQAETEQEMEERMFRLWTMKESFLKVTGLGMSLALNDFAVCINKANSIKTRPGGEQAAFAIKQKIDNKQYFLKEYQLSVTEEEQKYKISVCSTSQTFAPEIQQVLVQDILDKR